MTYLLIKIILSNNSLKWCNNYLRIKKMFNKLTVEQLSYMIGLFHGDGSLYETTRNRGRLSYEISVRDKDIVAKLVTILEPLVTCKVSLRKRNTNFKDNYESITLSIHDRLFREQLKEYMPSGKKSTSIQFDERLSFKHYLRGLSDADGSLGLADNRCFWSLCTSSEAVKCSVCTLIESLTGLTKHINRNARDGVYNIVVYNEDAQVLCNYMYSDAHIYMDRKHKKLKDVQCWLRTTPKKKQRSRSWTDSEDKLIQDSSYSLEEKVRLTERTTQSIKTRLWRLNKE